MNRITPVTQKLILIRGLPGSGKSTLAKMMSAEHVEADMYFIDNNGDYHFDETLLNQAHQWCIDRVKDLLNQGVDVVVSNTFVRYWEMKPYIELANTKSVELEIIHSTGSFNTIHNVNAATMEKMRKRWQPCEWLRQKKYQPQNVG
jgi:predicted kinase